MKSDRLAVSIIILVNFAFGRCEKNISGLKKAPGAAKNSVDLFVFFHFWALTFLWGHKRSVSGHQMVTLRDCISNNAGEALCIKYVFCICVVFLEVVGPNL